MSGKKREFVSIGGQAVLEGVMMRGKGSMALCVRNEQGEFLLCSERLPKNQNFFTRTPVFRGAISFFSSLILGVRVLLKSAEAEGEELTKKDTALMWASAFLGLALGVALFFLLPNFLAGLIIKDASTSSRVLGLCLIEAALRLTIIVAYMRAVTLLKSMRRTYGFHGAEHKTINCFESKLELSMQNVRGCSRLHPRCGTSFIFFVALVSIVVFSLVTWALFLIGVENNNIIRAAVRLALLPLVAGLSYEVLKGLARANERNILVKILKAPGMALQRLTTAEPDDDMIYAAITAFNCVMALESDESIPATDFGARSFKLIRAEVAQILASKSKSAQDYLILSALSIPKEALDTLSTITQSQAQRVLHFAREHEKGVPIERLCQQAEFFGCNFALNEHTLIPRGDTELVCERAIQMLEGGEGKSVLDLCTGSGCIGVSIARHTKARVTCADINPQALAMARQNAGQMEVEFVESNMFESIAGRTFDMIVCNPPYVKTADLNENLIEQDPVLALDGGEDGLKFYRILAQNLHSFLSEKGAAVLEVGHDTGKAAQELMQNAGFSTELIKDYGGNDRILICLVKD